jgi:hypothetical protein
LTNYNLPVIKRMHEHGACCSRKLAGKHQAITNCLSSQPNLRSVTLRRPNLRQRRTFRHENGCVDAERVRAERHALRVIARAGGADAAGALLLVQPGDEVVGAAYLEGARALHAFAFEEYWSTDGLGQPARSEHGRFEYDGLAVRCSLAELFESDVGHVGGGGHRRNVRVQK